ncbi:PepSY domain-containing protein [Isoptericola croceus]|uniref:PepSY domain-containing protein n=1 Tax=Isoptericola croceus TaxID=3031406 RepID=UPI0023F7A3D1|nr:hypothetical protein [Isoptericola croceus]
MTPHHSARPAGLAALSLSLGLVLAACAGDTSDDAPTDTSTATTRATDEASAETPDGAAGDEGQGPDDTEADDGGSDVLGDRTTTALAAIAAAESEAGGAAYAIHDDATSWEVDVAADDGTIEVTVDGTGTKVLATTPDGLDPADREALDSAVVGLAEAVQRVVGESGGTLQEADLETGDDAARWKVSILPATGGQEEYRVDLGDGSVTRDD